MVSRDIVFFDNEEFGAFFLDHNIKLLTFVGFFVAKWSK